MHKLLFAALLATAAAPALADSAANATLTDLRLEVIDLRPDDGIAAELHDISGLALARAWEGGVACEPGRVAGCNEARGTPLGSLVEASATFDELDFSRARLLGTEMSVAGRRLNDLNRGYGATSLIGGDSGRPLFVLSPYTAVRVTGRYDMNLALEAGSSLEVVQARVWAWGAGSGATDERLRLEAYQSNEDESASGSFAAVFSNLRDREAGVWGGLGVHMGGNVAAVPESGSHALMVAGLGVLGLVLRRRRCLKKNL